MSKENVPDEDVPDIGKMSPDRMEKLVSGCFGSPSSKVIVGPGQGLDAGIISLDDDRIMAVAEDPVFPAAGLSLEMFGQLTVHIGASDVAVTGVKPEFMTYSLLLPPKFPEKDTRTIISSISKTAAELEITIVGGHTGWYGAVTIPTVGGITVWGYAQKDKWISPGGAQDGDVLLMTKGPAIEAAALLAVLNKAYLARSMKADLLERVLQRTNEITVVSDASVAFKAGGVHSMHDATEGGVLCGLWEISSSAQMPLFADFDKITVPEDIAQCASILGFDPCQSISEGTLLLSVDPEHVASVTKALEDSGSTCFTLGHFDKSLSSSMLTRNGITTTLPSPGPDQFWDLFANPHQ
jgi:hydrogenase maturation factor